MGSNNSVVINGVGYSSLKEAYDSFRGKGLLQDVSYDAISKRINRSGWSLEEAFEVKNKSSIEVNGMKFDSIKHACEELHLNYETVISRRKLGWSLEESLGLVQKLGLGIRRKFTVQGKDFQSLRDVCDFYKVNYTTILSRLQRGWSIEESLGLVNRPEDLKVKVFGKSFTTLSEACDFYKVNVSSVRTRKRKKPDESLEDTISYVLSHQRNDFTLNGVLYTSIQEACNYYNLNPITIRGRLNNGWSLEEAFNLKERGRGGKSITVKGISFKTLTDACSYYNVSYNVVRNRLNSGYSLEEAIFKKSDYVKRYDSISVNGIDFKSISEVSVYFNVKASSVSYRINNFNESVEEAINYLLNRDNIDSSVELDGVVFSSLRDACNHYNKNVATVRNRISRGWSLEEALFLVPRCKDGIIVKRVWNDNFSESAYIEAYLGNDMYKCFQEGKVVYYSKEELFKKFKECKSDVK